MFCDQCGAVLQPAQRFCARCGKDVSGPAIGLHPSTNRVEENIRVLGILWFVVAGLDAVGGIFMWIIGSVLFPSMAQMGGAPPGVPIGALHIFFGIMGLLVLVKAGVDFLVGWGLLKHKSWARLVTIILSFFTILSFPLGTALAIYSLWVLLPAQSESEFVRLAANPPPGAPASIP